jgi:MFS family permease
MGRQIRLLFGISVFWLALSVLTDGINTLVLPLQINRLGGQQNQATILGLLTFVGLMAAALIQPIAGAFSDRLYLRLGRKGFIGIGLVLIFASLFIFAKISNLVGMIVGYLLLQISASIAQAGQQGLIPDLVDEHRRGLASGLKGFMDLAGAMLGFVILGQLLGAGRLLLAIEVIGGILLGSYLLAALLTPEDKPNHNSGITTHTIPLSKTYHLNRSEHPAFVQLVTSRFLFLLGIYATGRFLLLFVADRLGLSEEQAAEQAGNLLAALALITVFTSPLTGWLSDRVGRLPLMIGGAIFSAVSALLLIWANSRGQILLFGGLMSLGSSAFSGGSWALVADVVPRNEAGRFFGLANFSTAGSAALAGLFGLLVDWGDRITPGMGFSILFAAASLAFAASVLPLKHKSLKEIGEKDGNKRKESADGSGLAILSVPTDLASPEKDPHS